MSDDRKPTREEALDALARCRRFPDDLKSERFLLLREADAAILCAYLECNA